MEILEPGIHQLEPNPDRQGSADHPGDHRKHQIHRADVLVIGGIDVPSPSGGVIVRVMHVVGAVSRFHRCHVVSSISFAGPRCPVSYCVSRDSLAANAVGAESSLCAYFFLASSSQRLKSLSLTTRTAIGMKAWFLPQSSEHCP